MTTQSSNGQLEPAMDVLEHGWSAKRGDSVGPRRDDGMRTCKQFHILDAAQDILGLLRPRGAEGFRNPNLMIAPPRSCFSNKLHVYSVAIAIDEIIDTMSMELAP